MAECEAFGWDEKSVLVFENIKSSVANVVAPSLSAAVWETRARDEKGRKTCSAWQDSTDVFTTCVRRDNVATCKGDSNVFADNHSIAAMVQYAKSKGVNAFAIRSAHQLDESFSLNRPFHLLNFTLSSPQGVSAKDMRQRSIQQRQPGAHDWASGESGEKTLTADSSAESEAEQVQTENTVVATEHHVSVVKKESSKRADSTTNMPVSASAWRWGSSSSPTVATEEGSKESPREEAEKKIKEELSSPTSDMASSAPGVNDEGAALAA